jgi:predicted RND superfamily exporter protein
MIELLLKFRVLVVIVVVALCLVASAGVSKLGFASDYRVFFGEGNPELAEWDDFQATFARNDNVLFVLQNGEGAEFDVNLATVVEELTERAWLLPNATRVDSLSNFQRTKATADDLEVADLYEDAASLSEAEIKERLSYAMSEPALYKALISGDAKTTGVNVTIEVQGDPNQAVSDVALAAYGIADELRAKYPGLTVAMNGSMIMNYGFIESGMRDGMTLIPAMYAAMLLLTLIMLRSFSGMIATLITIVLSTTVALGIAGHLGMQMAPITIIAPNIILTLAIADCIHIISSVQKGLRAGLSKNDAIKESLRKNFTAVFVTSATTAVGFLCLNFSDAPPFQYLGNITAFGVLAAWILAITVVPVFLSFMPLKPAAKARASRLDGVLQGLANGVIANSRAVLIVGGIASVTIAGLALTNDLDDRFTRYFGKSLQVRQDLDFAAEHLRGQDNFEYEIKAPEGGSISNPDYLKTLDAFTLWLRDQPEVDQVTSLSDTIKRLNQNMNADDRDYYKIPETQEAAAQYLLLYELSLPFGLDLNNQINIDKSATRLSVVITDMKISKQQAFHQRVSDWANQNAPTGMIPAPTGTSVIFASLTMRNLVDMITGNIVAIVAIALMMMVTLRSISIGFISVVTNAIPALVTFGFWALTVGHIGMAVAVIGAASLGIVVDDSVHFLTKYLRGLREKNLSREDAIRYAFSEVGEAIVFTSVIVGIGFAIIAMSTFQVNAQLGLLTAITVVVAMVFDFIMLPAILLLGNKSPEINLTNGVQDVEFT